MTPRERVERIWDEAVGGDLTRWERHKLLPFLKTCNRITPRQESMLQEIECRVLGRQNGPELEEEA